MPRCREQRCRADARELQNLRRSDTAGGQDGFSGRLRETPAVARMSELDSLGAQGTVAGAHPHAFDQRVRHHREIRTRQRRPQKGLCRVPPHAALLVHLEERAAGIVSSIEFANFRNAAFLGRITPRFENLPSKARIFDAQLAADAVHVVGAVLIVLDLLEQRQHVVPRPSRVAERRPVVVILFLAAHVDHRVDGGAAAENLAARVVDRSACKVLVRLRLVAPVGAWIGDRVEIADRDVDPEPVVLPAGLEEQHLRGGICRQPVGQHAAGASGANDDVVERADGCRDTGVL